MPDVWNQHSNASLTPRGRRKMVRLVIDHGWTIEAAAGKFQVDAKTVTKWRDRFLTEGGNGLFDRADRSSRRTRRLSTVGVGSSSCASSAAAHIGHEVGRAGSRVQESLIAEGLGRLDSGGRATAEPTRRYQHDRPGALVHVAVKLLSGIPHGGGWRTHGHGQAPPVKRSSTDYRFLHSALDDQTQILYSEIHTDEQAVTAVAFRERANTYCNQLGITVVREITDNGSCYRSKLGRTTLESAGITAEFTRTYRPKTNGKIERFHRILLEEWAYSRGLHSDRERSDHDQHFVHFYNCHRAHGALGWSTPM